MKKSTIIKALKFDHKIHRTWTAEFIGKDEDLLTFAGKFENEIVHSQLGVIRHGTLSYEYYWLDRWYNIFRFHEPEGDLRNFYCNINLPPIFDNEVLTYVDLDIDILVWKNFDFEVLDLEEFEENSRLYAYPKKVVEKCYQTIEELKNMINLRRFPFDFINQ